MKFGIWRVVAATIRQEKKTLSLELVEAKKTFITLGIAQVLLLENEVFQLQHQLEGRQSMGCFMFLKCNKVC